MRVNVIKKTAPIKLPTGQPFHKDATNRLLIHEALKAAGVRLEWPVETRCLLALLRLAGYEATRAVLDYHLAKSYFPAPRKVKGNFSWTEQDAVNAADSLESTRNFVPLHPSHIHKLTPTELHEATIEAARRKAELDAYCGMEPDDLIHLLMSSDDLSVRERAAFALKRRLGMLDYVGTQTPTAPESN